MNMKFVIVFCNGCFKYCFILLIVFNVLFYVVMKLELVTRKNVSHVELEKDEKHCLGMTIADGTKDQAGPVVKKVKSKSPVGRSFAVSEGDVILSFNGNSTVGSKSKDIIRMIKEAGSSVDFKLQYELREIRISQTEVYCKRQRKIVLHKVGDNFGFVLRKEDVVNLFSEDYPVISNVKAGSCVHRHGFIQDGDRLVKVDDVNLSCMSLLEIAHLLQTRCKAEFVYQYDVGVIEFPEPGRKVSLDIDVPCEDLGINLSAGSEDSGLMFIDKIRLGSIAERCGLFSEGDIILSIDEIDTRFLTVSKAYTLLQNCKKCRKIAFIPGKRKRISPLREKCTDQRDTNKIDLMTNKPYTAEKNLHVSERLDIQFPNKQGFCLQKLCLNEQMKSIYYLQNIVKVIRKMKEIQSEVKLEKKSLNVDDYCTFCDGSHDSKKFCLLFLSKVNVACAQSIDVLQNIVSHSIFHSFTELQGKYEANMEEKEIRDNAVKVNKLELVHALTETLPDVFFGDYHLKERLLDVAKKIYHADASCSICDLHVGSIWITVQKILLLLSVDYSSHESKVLIKRLLCCLLKADLSCPYLTMFKSNGRSDFQHESSMVTPSVHCNNDPPLSDSDCYSIQSDLDSESIVVRTPSESNLTNPQIYMQKDYLKITHIQSLCASEESRSDNDLCEADKDIKTLVRNSPRLSRQENNLKPSSNFLKCENATSNRDEKFANGKVLNRAPVKLWRSLDSLLKSVGAAKDQPGVSQRFAQNASKCTVTKTSGINQNIPGTSSDNVANRLPTNHKPPTNGGHSSDFREGSNPSPFTNSSEKNSQGHSNKIRTDTIEVKMTNSGEGFGLGLGLKFISSKSSVVPVIQTIQPRSPSQRTGVLKTDDRIVAINHRSTLGLTPQQLQVLQKKAFLADAVTLTVEFDVVDEELKIGTFDVLLDKTLKIGLLFEDMQRGYPMVVSGVVKGSSAHRCGQLFPGDKITFFKCIRNEEFDPVSCNYSKEESVLITVRRDRIEGIREKSANVSPCYVNPCFSHKDSVPRRGQAFVVNSSAIHVVDGTDSLVLDQDVTLFRDPVSWDFGFLVGENPDTGRAYVTDVRPGGPASKSGVMKKFDRILEVNGVSVNKNLEHSVLSLLSQANNKVDLLIRRLYQEDSTIV